MSKLPETENNRYAEGLKSLQDAMRAYKVSKKTPEEKQALHDKLLDLCKPDKLPDDMITEITEYAKANPEAQDVCLDATQINLRLQTLQDEIREWSFRNFGGFNENISKLTGLPLGNMSPLLGMCEEVSEYSEAYHVPAYDKEDDDSLTQDAICDVMIFLLDFCNRTPFVLYVEKEDVFHWMQEKVNNETLSQNGLTPPIPEDAVGGLALFVGKLHHVMLKAHQGIRGYDNPAKYKTEAMKAARNIFMYLMMVTGFRMLTFVEKTWAEVKQRDWKKNAANAHTVAAQPDIRSDAASPSYDGVLVQDALPNEAE